MTAVLEPAGLPTRLRPDAVAAALDALRSGHPVLVVDGDARGGEGAVVLPAALADPARVAWTVRHTSGLLQVPMEAVRADELRLPPMVRGADPLGTAHTVSVDAATGVGTGISARDRARTARVLADPASVAGDLTRPGHVLPVRARPGGVVERAGHAEAAVDLCRLAGLPPVGVIATVVTGPGTSDGGRTANRSEIGELGARHDVPVLDVADLVRHRHRYGDGIRARVRRTAGPALPTDRGGLHTVGFHDGLTGAEHLAVVSAVNAGHRAVVGSVAAGTEHRAVDGSGTAGSGRREVVGPVAAGRPMLAVHTACPAGDVCDVVGGSSCRCRRELDDSLAAVARTGGAVVHLRAPAGAGVPGAGGAAAAVAAELGFTRVRLRPGPVRPEDLRAGGIDAVEAIDPP